MRAAMRREKATFPPYPTHCTSRCTRFRHTLKLCCTTTVGAARFLQRSMACGNGGRAGRGGNANCAIIAHYAISQVALLRRMRASFWGVNGARHAAGLANRSQRRHQRRGAALVALAVCRTVNTLPFALLHACFSPGMHLPAHASSHVRLLPACRALAWLRIKRLCCGYACSLCRQAVRGVHRVPPRRRPLWAFLTSANLRWAKTARALPHALRTAAPAGGTCRLPSSLLARRHHRFMLRAATPSRASHRLYGFGG